MPVYLVPYFTTLPIVVGLVAIAIGAIRRERMLRRWRFKKLEEDTAKALTIPEGMVEVQTGALARREGLVFAGVLMLIGVGTPGLKRLLDTLILLAMMKLDDMVGSILVYECTSSSRNDFANRLPVVYHERVVYGSARDFPNGFSNLDPWTVETLIGQWGPELKDAVAEVVKLHEERNGAKPGQVIDFPSLGGHAFPGVYLLRELQALIGNVQTVGVINLPRKTPQREWFPYIKDLSEKVGLDAWVVSDQAQPDWVTVDGVASGTVAALASSALCSDGGIAINNVFTNAAGVGNKGGMVRFTYLYSDAVAHPLQIDTNGTLHPHVPLNTAVSELRRTIAAIENGEGAVSIDVPVQSSNTHIYDIAVVQLDPRVTRDIRDEIERSRDLEDTQLAHLERPHRHPLVDYETVYTSWSLSVDPIHPRCRFLLVRLQAINAPLEVVVAAPQNRPKPDTPKDDAPAPEPVVAHSRSNGMVLPDDLDF
jgi:hypothetical protein